MKNGFKMDEAFQLDDEFRMGFCIAIGEIEGGVFNWDAMAFEEPKNS